MGPIETSGGAGIFHKGPWPAAPSRLLFPQSLLRSPLFTLLRSPFLSATRFTVQHSARRGRDFAAHRSLQERRELFSELSPPYELVPGCLLTILGAKARVSSQASAAIPSTPDSLAANNGLNLRYVESYYIQFRRCRLPLPVRSIVHLLP